MAAVVASDWRTSAKERYKLGRVAMHFGIPFRGTGQGNNAMGLFKQSKQNGGKDGWQLGQRSGFWRKLAQPDSQKSSHASGTTHTPLLVRFLETHVPSTSDENCRRCGHLAFHRGRAHETWVKRSRRLCLQRARSCFQRRGALIGASRLHCPACWGCMPQAPWG